MYHGFGGNFLGMGFGWLLTLLFVAFVVWLVARTINRDGGASQGHSSDRTALEILKERYARGEIDRQEYEERKRILHG